MRVFWWYKNGEYFWEPLLLLLAALLSIYFIISVTRFATTRVDVPEGDIYLSNTSVSERDGAAGVPAVLAPGTVNRPVR